MRRRRKNKSLKIKLITGGLVLIILIAVIVGIKLFSIQNIGIVGNVSCIDDIKKLKVSNILRQNLFFVSEKKLEEDIKLRYFCVKSIDLRKNFPNSVSIEVFERVPKINVITVDTEASNSAYIIENLINETTSSSKLNLEGIQKKGSLLSDEEGIIFKNSSQEDLPKLYVWTDLKLGQKLQSDVIGKILIIIRQLDVFGINIQSSILDSNGTYLMYSDPLIYFNLKGSLDFQTASLQLILKEAKIITDVKYIDLRFDKPIIKLAPKKINEKR